MSTTGRPVRHGAPGWMKLALVLSLTANLVVVGLVIGNWLAGDERPSGIERQIGWMIGVVPEERRDMAEAHFEAARPQFEAAQAGRLDQFGNVLAVMRAEPFDAEALSTAMTETLQSRSAQRALVYDRFATLLDQFTPAERTAIAERMERWVSRRAEERNR